MPESSAPRWVPDVAWRWWCRTRPLHAPTGLVAGFLWDALTLRRIDRLSDNLLLLGYLLLLGVLLVIERRVAHPDRRMPASPGATAAGSHGRQFPLFGGLYSAYVVYYAKSTSPGRALVFLALLLGLLVVDGLLDHVLRVETLRLLLYGFCAFSFLLFFVPVVTGHSGAWVPPVAAGSAPSAWPAASRSSSTASPAGGRRSRSGPCSGTPSGRSGCSPRCSCCSG